ncbi:BspA family leucine-rich repeat surface protein [Flavobacteriaceae bacterium]|nr:BspA family leucine-rich repeat surface protein [Flavobacteriaceae bacterium]
MKKLIYIVLLAILPFWAQAQIGMSIQNNTIPPAFVSTWDTNNINTVGDPTNQIILPLMTSGSYAFVVDWGDGSTSVVTNTNMSTNATRVYGVSGIYTLTITGRILGWLMLSSESKKITEISQWGTLKAGALGFFNCENLLISASDALDLEANLSQMFQGCSSLVSLDASNWDTSSVTNFRYMFNGCSSLVNLNVSDWDVGSLQSAHYAFYNSPMISALNIASWKNKNSNSITNFTAMFRGCSSLTTLDVRGWDVSSGTNFIDFAFGVTIPTAIYDQTLVNWEALNLQPGASQEIDFGNSKYTAGSAAETARANIIANDGWAISDGGSTP